MKKFKGVRSQEEIVRRMRKLGYSWTKNSRVAYEQGSDYNGFQNENGIFVMVNVFSGIFWVKDVANNKRIATNNSYELDDEKWYSDILEAINIPLEDSKQ